jgi:type VI secretion system protein ImpH
MAGQVGGPSFNLKLDLLKHGYEFSFFQVLRLLRLFSQDSEKSEEKKTIEEEKIRIRPELSLAFPASDVAGIEELTKGEGSLFSVTATMLGLYGSSSPLPTFYTEDLLDEASEDMSVTRDFIDLINHRLYLLLFRCWVKYREFLQVVEENNPKDLEKLFCLLGLGEKELRKDLPEAYSLIRYAGLFTQFPRSSWGLETMLQDALSGVPIEVIPCVKRIVKIPEDQRLFLGASGCSLGEDSFLGEEIDDRMGKFRLQIGPLKSTEFHSLLPGNPHHHWLSLLTEFYLKDPLEYDLELGLKEREAETVCLGGPMWSKLGWDTWTFSTKYIGEVKATLPPEKI